jgi:hypothetical protein
MEPGLCGKNAITSFKGGTFMSRGMQIQHRKRGGVMRGGTEAITIKNKRVQN